MKDLIEIGKTGGGMMMLIGLTFAVTYILHGFIRWLSQ